MREGVTPTTTHKAPNTPAIQVIKLETVLPKEVSNASVSLQDKVQTA